MGGLRGLVGGMVVRHVISGCLGRAGGEGRGVIFVFSPFFIVFFYKLMRR